MKVKIVKVKRIIHPFINWLLHGFQTIYFGDYIIYYETDTGLEDRISVHADLIAKYPHGIQWAIEEQLKKKRWKSMWNPYDEIGKEFEIK